MTYRRFPGTDLTVSALGLGTMRLPTLPQPENPIDEEKAIAMMRESDMSISQIAEACGFSEYRYFRVVFQKKIGCSPAQYSQEVRLMRNDGNECVE